jgi:Uma2 family endonuclease
VSTAPVEDRRLGPRSAGVVMTPEEFDAIDDYDPSYCYELIHGVLVVSPIPSPEETGPNELLGHLLMEYKEHHPQGSALDSTLAQQYVAVAGGRRLADRLIWAGLGRQPRPRRDPATIAAEFVSPGSRNRKRDYQDKRRDYAVTGMAEYWIIARFPGTSRPSRGKVRQSVLKRPKARVTFAGGLARSPDACPLDG